jgi:hypothetical protein
MPAADARTMPDAAPTATEVKLGCREVVGIIGGLALAMFLGALNQAVVATALEERPLRMPVLSPSTAHEPER